MKTRKTFQRIILLFAILLSTLDSFGQIIKVYLENTGNETINVAFGYHYTGLFSEKSTYSGWYVLKPGDNHFYASLGVHHQASIAFSKRGGYVIYKLKNANNKNIGVDGFYVNPDKSFEYIDGNYAKSYSPIMTSYRVAQAYCYKCEGQTLKLTLAVPSNTTDEVIPFKNKEYKPKARNKIQFDKLYIGNSPDGRSLMMFTKGGEVLIGHATNKALQYRSAEDHLRKYHKKVKYEIKGNKISFSTKNGRALMKYEGTITDKEINFLETLVGYGSGYNKKYFLKE